MRLIDANSETVTIEFTKQELTDLHNLKGISAKGLTLAARKRKDLLELNIAHIYFKRLSDRPTSIAIINEDIAG